VKTAHWKWAGAAVLAAALIAGNTVLAQSKYAVIPPNKDSDLKLYLADGKVVKGAEAMARMQSEAKLVLWLAGNQFFAMDDVVHAFQARHPGVEVGLITLPPGFAGEHT